MDSCLPLPARTSFLKTGCPEGPLDVIPKDTMCQWRCFCLIRKQVMFQEFILNERMRL